MLVPGNWKAEAETGVQGERSESILIALLTSTNTSAMIEEKSFFKKKKELYPTESQDYRNL